MSRAKFRCVEKTLDGHVVLEAVTGGSPENDSFFKATPQAKIDLKIVNPTALAEFEKGKEFYVDFSRVDRSLAADESFDFSQAVKGKVCPKPIVDLLEHLKQEGTGKNKLEALHAIGLRAKTAEAFMEEAKKLMPEGTIKKIEDYAAKQKAQSGRLADYKEAGKKSGKDETGKDASREPGRGQVSPSEARETQAAASKLVITDTHALEHLDHDGSLGGATGSPASNEVVEGSSPGADLTGKRNVSTGDSGRSDSGRELGGGVEQDKPNVAGGKEEGGEDPVGDMSADEAKDKISRMMSTDKLEQIVVNDKRVSVQKAAQARLDELAKR